MKKLNNKGFTLIELLAVIAILAILIVIAVPGVLSLYNSGRKTAFETQVKSIWRSIETSIVKDTIDGKSFTCYLGGQGITTPGTMGTTELSGTSKIRYLATVNGGKVTELTVEQLDAAGTSVIFRATDITSIDTITSTEPATTEAKAPTITVTSTCS